jgi:DNA-binding transcriptional LysR family regulator
MDYNDIPVFLRVVETSSFTKAAELLGVQKSSVSRSIGRLESELGVRLLQRTTRNLGLTDAGQTFYERVRGAWSGFEDAATTVRELGTEPRGSIRMTAVPGSAAFGLAHAIASFTQQYPSITVEVESSTRIVDLVSEGFDIALRAGRLADSSLIAKKVGTTDLVLLAAPSYLDRAGRPRTVQDLAQHECVLFRGRGGHATWEIRSRDGEEIVDVHGAINSNEAEFVVDAAIAGVGIAAMPPQLAREAIDRGQLEVVLPTCHLKGGDIHIVLPSSAFVPSRVMLFRDHLVKELSARNEAVHRQCAAKGHDFSAAPASASSSPPKRRRARQARSMQPAGARQP